MMENAKRYWIGDKQYGGLHPLADGDQPGPDVLEFLNGLHATVHAAAVLREPLPRTFQREPLVLHQKLNLLERIDILRMKQAVPLGVPLRMDELLKVIAPVAHRRGIFSQHLRHLTHCINQLCHNVQI